MSYNNYRPGGISLIPPVVKNLLIINGIFFLATIVAHNRFQVNLISLLGLHYPLADNFKPYQIITHMFMHANEFHLFLNMLALWMFGNSLENLWGGKRFLIFYMITGISAAFSHYLVFYFTDILPREQLIDSYFLLGSLNDLESAKAMLYNSIPVSLGASGAVFGLLLGFGMFFPNQIIYLFFAIPIQAKYFVILYGFIELFQGFRNSSADNVGHFAHLGGMLFGYILIKYWQKKGYKH